VKPCIRGQTCEKFCKKTKLIKAEDFITKRKLLNLNHFTRTRKMPPNKLILSILAHKGTNLSTELRRQQLYPQDKPISKPGYTKQRQKLNTEAITTLIDYHNQDLYKNNKPDLKTYKKIGRAHV
jgi:hypothetical protein